MKGDGKKVGSCSFLQIAVGCKSKIYTCILRGRFLRDFLNDALKALRKSIFCKYLYSRLKSL